jgi:hypothetical protein
VRIKRYSSLRGFNPAPPTDGEGLRNANSRTSKGQRSEKKIINIDFRWTRGVFIEIMKNGHLKLLSKF